MGSFRTIDEARDYFSKDRFATDNGMTLDEVDERHAVTSMTLGDGHRNAFGDTFALRSMLFTRSSNALWFLAAHRALFNVIMRMDLGVDFRRIPLAQL